MEGPRMKATITIEVADDWLAQRVAEVNASYPHLPRSEPGDYMRDRIADFSEDELPLALWGWPIETTVDVEP